MADVQIGYLSADTLSNIGDAIRRKNGSATKYQPSQMDAAIDAIVTLSEGTADATATSADMLKNTTAYVKGVKVTGSIETATAIVTTINPGASQDVPAGYYTAKSTISASLADTEDEIDGSLKQAGATQSVVPGESVTVSGGKYYTSDSVITADKAKNASQVDVSIKVAGVTQTIAPGESTTIEGGKFYTSNGTVSASKATTLAQIDNSIKEDKSVTAPLTGSTDVAPTDGKVLTAVTVNAPDTTATATAEDILTGKTAYVNGVKVTGTRPESTGGVDTSDATAEAGDIAEGKTAYINGGKVTGTMAVISCYSGDTEPSNALGNDGDIYILVSDTEEAPATAGSISTTNNSISLSDDLPSDTYTLKYEDASGNPISEWAEIGTVTK